MLVPRYKCGRTELYNNIMSNDVESCYMQLMEGVFSILKCLLREVNSNSVTTVVSYRTPVWSEDFKETSYSSDEWQYSFKYI